MPRRVAKASRSQQAPVANTVTVVSGSIRPRDDEDVLAVKLSIWDTEITMRANGSELGNWPTNAVDIRSLDATSFEFVAEGDHLIFFPDDPEEFGHLPLVSGSMLRTGRKKSRKSKEKHAPQQPELAWDQDSAEEKRRHSQRPKRDAAVPKEKKQSRRQRKTAAAPPVEAVAAPARPPVSTPKLPPVAEPFAKAVVEHVLEEPPRQAPEEAAPQQTVVTEPAKESPRERRRERRASNGSVEPSHTGGLKEKRHQVWILALDQARKYDLLGLDRVPVNESLRGQEHEHTWNHRVAPPSGLGSRICTLCGEFRRQD